MRRKYILLKTEWVSRYMCDDTGTAHNYYLVRMNISGDASNLGISPENCDLWEYE